MTPRPFTLKVSDAVLTDLRARLERVRWPDEAPAAGWQHGTDLALHEGAGRLLARPLRLAGARGAAEPASAVHGAGRRHRHPLHPRARRRPGADAAAAVARLARIDRGVRADHPDADRSRALRRRSRRRLHGGRALAARLRVLLPAGPAAVRHRGDRRPVRVADDRRPRLPALRRPGRRLGRVRLLLPGRGVSRSRGRHPRQPAGGAARSDRARDADRRGEEVPRRASRTGCAKRPATCRSRAPSRRRSPTGSPTRR